MTVLSRGHGGAGVVQLRPPHQGLGITSSSTRITSQDRLEASPPSLSWNHLLCSCVPQTLLF